MIVCPNCNHQNPDGAIQCEACYTPLPAMSSCPNCGAAVQSDATFCGQCGYDLRSNESSLPPTVVAASPLAPTVAAPPLPAPDPLVEPEPLVAGAASARVPSPSAGESTVATPPPVPPAPAAAPPRAGGSSKTELQVQTAKLLHLQTNKELELPLHLSVIHIGKPNDRIPPDIDVSGFPHSEVVSRIHADIRVEGDGYYIEDVGSSNGTYINNFPLPTGNRHRLRPGDRIALGKGDMVTFLFQIS
ncbi:FHA domain-containing protein [Kamptonema formosum]|uniref:FHA domain-containing protein n=1 Tax=Kamptonema formosum TaxID=331992 RepID=UPI000477DD2A|nr:FHA domain-containing protein [Oscillatoria sp. PCC 10802]